MSRLEKLAQMVRSLPEMERERGRIAIAVRVGEEAAKTAQFLTFAHMQAPHIDVLADSKIVQVVEDAVTSSTQQAKILKKLVRRENFGTEQKISEHLENLSKKLQGVETKRTDVWSKVQREVNTVQTILEIAMTLKLESVPALTAAINNFKVATASPPSTESDAQGVVDARKANTDAVANSGLSGNIKKILEGAIKSEGDPRLLLEADVQKFFREHPALWTSLKLKLT
jgi:hypothetical protein